MQKRTTLRCFKCGNKQGVRMRRVVAATIETEFIACSKCYAWNTFECCDSAPLRCRNKKMRDAEMLKSKKLSSAILGFLRVLIARMLEICDSETRHKMSWHRAMKPFRAAAIPLLALLQVILCHCLFMCFSLAILCISIMKIHYSLCSFLRIAELSFLVGSVPSRTQMYGDLGLLRHL